MASGVYVKSVSRFFGGDIDYINSSFSAFLIDLSVYAPDLLNDEDLNDIPEAAILSEASFNGRFITDLNFYGESIVFPSVAASETVTGGAVVIFKESEFNDGSYLCFLLDSEVSSDLPIPLDGTDITVNWPASGLMVATV